MELGRTLIGLGLVLLVAGFCVKIGANLPLGRLPGDLKFQLGGLTLYLPLISCVLLSLVASLGVAIFRHFIGR